MYAESKVICIFLNPVVYFFIYLFLLMVNKNELDISQFHFLFFFFFGKYSHFSPNLFKGK